MLGETFELTRDDLDKQRATMVALSRYLRQRNVDRLFLTVGKILYFLFALLFWLVVVIVVLMPSLELFLNEPIRWGKWINSVHSAIVLRILMLVCRRSMDVGWLVTFAVWAKSGAWKKFLRSCPIQVTWKLEGETFDYKGRIRHLVLSKRHLLGQDVKRIGNWIGITAGLRPKMYTISSEELAMELETELRRIAGEPAVATPSKRVSMWLLIGVIVVGVALKRFL